MSAWVRVNKARRCPICGRADWCLIARDGTAAICPRTPSEKRAGDAGWLHRLRGTTPISRTAGTTAELPVARLSEAELTALVQRFQCDLSVKRLHGLARFLCVTAESLQRLGVGWSWNPQAFAFPMTDAVGRIRGIRLRTPGGRKFAVRGGREGLFVPSALSGDGPLLLPEGPTSCAAALSLGFDAIGRPSCRGGERYLRPHCRNRDVVVVADRDDHGAGQRGALALGRALFARCSSVRVIQPSEPYNDLRDWLRAGASVHEVRQLIGDAESWTGQVVAATTG